jgi:pSer/pThr/pTyr-binding forkhead associated (FHA) protein
MKLNLVVLTPGKWEGKVIAITLPQFVIGRDAECQLRPASAVISKKHCAVLIRGTEVFVRDFESTNGTFVNSEKVVGERSIQNDDRLSIGPLLFKVQLEITTPVNKPTPVPPTRTPSKGEEDDAAAALLLSLSDDSTSGMGGAVDSQGIPTGSTVMETVQLPAEAGAKENGQNGAAAREKAAKTAAADTSVAAKAILDKYIRRPRA